MRGLEGRTALITGCASPIGIGFAAALRLAQAGARVLLTDLDGPRVTARAADLVEAGFDAVALQQDVTSEAAWAQAEAALTEAFGGWDILVNNAGIAVLGPLDRMPMADWRLQIDVNLTSTFLGCRAAVSAMRRRGAGGSIVNVSSVAGLVGMPGAAAYAASKGGVRLMSKALAVECAPDAIRVNSVHPGVILTEIQETATRDNPGVGEAISSAVPLRRMGAPEDVAAAIAFLASADAAYITGTELVVDGGLTAQ